MRDVDHSRTLAFVKITKDYRSDSFSTDPDATFPDPFPGEAGNRFRPARNKSGHDDREGRASPFFGAD